MHVWVVEFRDNSADGWGHLASYRTRQQARARIRANIQSDRYPPYPWKFFYRIRKFVPEVKS
jgi:hypothetical protein